MKGILCLWVLLSILLSRRLLQVSQAPVITTYIGSPLFKQNQNFCITIPLRLYPFNNYFQEIYVLPLCYTVCGPNQGPLGIQIKKLGDKRSNNKNSQAVYQYSDSCCLQITYSLICSLGVRTFLISVLSKGSDARAAA